MPMVAGLRAIAAMSMPFYVAPEQVMKDRADYARKGIARGRSLVALAYDDGIVIVAENPRNTLRKVSEIYDRIAFAGVGKYNEFDQLRIAGVRAADLKGYQYSRDDVDARSLANQYAQILGQVFTHEMKPMEVEILVAEVGVAPAGDLMFHILYDGTVIDEHSFSVLGGEADTVTGAGRGGLPGGDAAGRGGEAGGDGAGRPRPHAARRRARGRGARPQQRAPRFRRLDDDELASRGSAGRRCLGGLAAWLARRRSPGGRGAMPAARRHPDDGERMADGDDGEHHQPTAPEGAAGRPPPRTSRRSGSAPRLMISVADLQLVFFDVDVDRAHRVRARSRRRGAPTASPRPRAGPR